VNPFSAGPFVGDESLAESLVEEEMKRLMAPEGAGEDVGLLPSPGTRPGPAGRGGRKSRIEADKAALAKQAMAALEAAEGAAAARAAAQHRPVEMSGALFVRHAHAVHEVWRCRLTDPRLTPP